MPHGHQQDVQDRNQNQIIPGFQQHGLDQSQPRRVDDKKQQVKLDGSLQLLLGGAGNDVFALIKRKKSDDIRKDQHTQTQRAVLRLNGSHFPHQVVDDAPADGHAECQCNQIHAKDVDILQFFPL